MPQNINCDVTSLYSSVANPDIYLHPGKILYFIVNLYNLINLLKYQILVLSINNKLILVSGNIINSEVEVGDEVLAGLDTVDLGSHASRLLEDHDDITSVFSQIPVDAFNDLFTSK